MGCEWYPSGMEPVLSEVGSELMQTLGMVPVQDWGLHLGLA